MKLQGLLTATLICAQLLCASVSQAAIPRSVIRYQHQSLKLSLFFDFSKGFDIASIRPVESLRGMKSGDVEKYIPHEMAPTSDSGLVATQILDRSLNTWLHSESVRQSDFGRTAHRVEKNMEQTVVFGGAEPNTVKHSVNFAVKASQAKAVIGYSGITNAAISYQIAAAKLDVEIREPIAALNTSVVFNHTTQDGENRDVLSLRWNW